MDTLPNEVIRMILEHLYFDERSAIERVSQIFKFLNLSIPMKQCTTKNGLGFDVIYTYEDGSMNHANSWRISCAQHGMLGFTDKRRIYDLYVTKLDKRFI